MKKNKRYIKLIFIGIINQQIIVEEEYFNELPSRKLGQTIFSDYENLDVVIKK